MADQINFMMNLLQHLSSCGRRYFSAGQYINLNFNIICMRCKFLQPHHILFSGNSILTFAISVLLNFLEIKYQGKTDSPFETHPKTMFFAVTSLILYCFSYDAHLRISSSTTDHISSNSYVDCVIRISIAFFGPLSLASLTSVLLPDRLSPFIFSVSFLFSLCELPCNKLFRIPWNLVKQVIRFLKGRRGGRRKRRRPASDYMPRFSLSEHANGLLAEQVDILPV